MCRKVASGLEPSQHGLSPNTGGEGKHVNDTGEEKQVSAGHPVTAAHLSFGQQQWLVGFIPKERRMVQLEEDKARKEKKIFKLKSTYDYMLYNINKKNPPSYET